ncbi:DUF3108 domain-containing protein [Tropicimonas sp. IMCC6043]|uniref:DUF3108 domain-containing protein n=1 Tax=Tropicimonas sp. IMCC6043 TaxID=2510645 RepID=UPI00101BB419|nr:DUF3108 domain-containing protein [Tropicimonas sp. IMCC6043]RYH08544.1 DUF3108 domain-containing protein [Tropicimonas sp. IMCC6043]
MRRPLIVAALLFLSLPACAEDGQFSVSLSGIPAGVLAYSGSESGGRYTTRGEAASTGLARGLYPTQVTTVASGRVEGNRYTPEIYKESTTKKGETKTTAFRYLNGRPEITKNPPDTRRKSYHADPQGQAGTVDPMTAAYAILRDRPAGLACNLDISPYDGRERTRIRLSGGKREGDTLTCPGTYSRVAGFSDKDMAERVHWPFTVVYSILPDGTHRVSKVTVPTSLGKLRMTRH